MMAFDSLPDRPLSDDQEQREETRAREPLLVQMSEVEPEEVVFLWHPYIPMRKLSMLIGDPGVAKTWEALGICAAISRGLPLPGPDGRPTERMNPGRALYLTAEDGLADTIRPRLDALGAEARHIFVLDGYKTDDGSRREVSLGDLDVIGNALARVEPTLMVIDPIQGFLGADTDMHRANEVRPLLAGLGRLADEFDCAILVVGHLRKAGADRAIYRGLGSVDFAAYARSIMLVGLDPENPDRRVVAHVKSSLAKIGPSFAFEIVDGEFRWAGSSNLNADDLLAAQPRKSAREQAESFLLDALDRGPVKVTTLQDLAENKGLAWRTVNRAKTNLGVIARKEGFGGGWVWALPEERQAEDGHE
jgi:hypothetical protein